MDEYQLYHVSMTKIRIFDFDDTLVNTSSKVFITKTTGEKITLTSEEFATYEIEPNDLIDFSDFDVIQDPQVRKHRIVLEKMLYTRRSKNKVVICTARAVSATKAIKNWLVKEFGKKAYHIEVICLGDSDPEAKADIAEELVKAYNASELYFADDSWPNVRAVGNRMDKYDIKMKLQKV